MENTMGTTPGSTGYSGAEPSLMEQTKEQTQQVVQKTQAMAGQVADRAREQVKSQLVSQKERANSSLGNVAEALRRTGEQLREHDQAIFAGYADSLAEWTERCSGYLRNHDLDQMVWEVENFARRQPVLFLGGMFALGFLASRFLKASSERGGYYGAAGGDGYDSMRRDMLPTAYERATEDLAYRPASGAAGIDVPPAEVTSTSAPPAGTTAATATPGSASPVYEPAPGAATTAAAMDEEERADTDELAGTRRE